MNEKIFSQDSFFLSEKLVLKPSLPEGIILTDDFSLVERLMKPIVQEYFPSNMTFLKNSNKSHFTIKKIIAVL